MKTLTYEYKLNDYFKQIGQLINAIYDDPEFIVDGEPCYGLGDELKKYTKKELDFMAYSEAVDTFFVQFEPKHFVFQNKDEKIFAVGSSILYTTKGYIFKDEFKRYLIEKQFILNQKEQDSISSDLESLEMMLEFFSLEQKKEMSFMILQKYLRVINLISDKDLSKEIEVTKTMILDTTLETEEEKLNFIVGFAQATLFSANLIDLETELKELPFYFSETKLTLTNITI